MKETEREKQRGMTSCDPLEIEGLPLDFPVAVPGLSGPIDTGKLTSNHVSLLVPPAYLNF